LIHFYKRLIFESQDVAAPGAKGLFGRLELQGW